MNFKVAQSDKREFYFVGGAVGGQVPGDISPFYSGPGGYANQTKPRNGQIKRTTATYKVLGRILVTNTNGKTTRTSPPNLAAQALPKLSSGIVYVMLPSDTKNTNWQKDSVWDWPNLGLAVTEVVRVNPDNNEQETIKGGALTAGVYIPG